MSTFNIKSHHFSDILQKPTIAIVLIWASLGGVCLGFIIMAFLPCGWRVFLSGYGSFVGGVICCLIAIANAILLYQTLQTQREDIEKQHIHFKQERFETTFFNLLDYHRKLTDGLSATQQTINATMQIISNSIQGRFFFTFALNDIALIEESLASPRYLGTFDADVDSRSIEMLDYKYAEEDPMDLFRVKREEEEQRLHHMALLKQINSLYLSKKEWEDLHGDMVNKKVNSYKLFYHQLCGGYEHYIRSLIQLLSFIKEQNEGYTEDIIRYGKYVQMQMSQNELSLLVLHAESKIDCLCDLMMLISLTQKKSVL